MTTTDFNTSFCRFIDASPSVFHATKNVMEYLEQKEFIQLKENQPWALKAGKGYFVARNDSSVIAFTLPKKVKTQMPVRLVTSHLDSPAPRLKMRAIREAAGLTMLPIEIYGGTILNTWLDRPLGIAGRTFSRKSGAFTLFNREHAAVIPNLAIHLNRKCNEGEALNPQNDMAAIIDDDSNDSSLPAILGMDENEALISELFLYDDAPAAIIGSSKAIVNAPRLDNLSSSFAALNAIAEAKGSPEICISFFADNEEIGSRTPQGADSSFLKTVITRIMLALGGSLEDTYIAFANSTFISADAAHALHPNHPEKHDPKYAPLMGYGVALKTNVSGRYCTTGPMLEKFIRLADENNIALQLFTNRADMPCGSTVGPTTAAELGIPGIDLGIPMLAMHSARETAALSDIHDLYDLMRCYYLG